MAILYATTSAQFLHFGTGASAGSSGAPPDPYGSELVTNGTFTTNSDWTLQEDVTITGGVCVMAYAGTYATLLDQSIGIELGKTYHITFNITSYTSGKLRFGLGDTDNLDGNGLDYTSTQAVSVDIVYDNASAPAMITFYSWDVAANMSIDNVSVKEVL